MGSTKAFFTAYDLDPVDQQESSFETLISDQGRVERCDCIHLCRLDEGVVNKSTANDEFGMIQRYSDLAFYLYRCSSDEDPRRIAISPNTLIRSTVILVCKACRLASWRDGRGKEGGRPGKTRLLDEPTHNLALFFFSYFSAKKRPILFVGSLGFLGTCCVHGPATH